MSLKVSVRAKVQQELELEVSALADTEWQLRLWGTYRENLAILSKTFRTERIVCKLELRALRIIEVSVL